MKNSAGRSTRARSKDFLRLNGSFATLQEDHLPLPREFFEEDLKSGRVVVLLDGMDEVGDRELRRRVARMIEKFAAHSPATPTAVFVVPCRKMF